MRYINSTMHATRETEIHQTIDLPREKIVSPVKDSNSNREPVFTTRPVIQSLLRFQFHSRSSDGLYDQ